ncbi:MAG: hypothetical protein AB7N76_37040, partial [Planctomycetota bacterium]
MLSRAALLPRLLVASLCMVAGCSSTPEEEGRRAELIPSNEENEGGVEPDLAKAKGLAPLLDKPRRYPFTIAVAPLLIEFRKDQARAEEDLENPLPFLPVERVRAAHKHASLWPTDSDWPEEEVEIVRVLREGFSESNGKPGEQPQQPKGEQPKGEQPKAPEGEQPKAPEGEQPKAPEGEQPKAPEGEQPKAPEGEQPKA